MGLHHDVFGTVTYLVASTMVWKLMRETGCSTMVEQNVGQKLKHCPIVSEGWCKVSLITDEARRMQVGCRKWGAGRRVALVPVF